MNCPKCGEKPVGPLHAFTLGGVTFNESLQGYFKCRKCGAMLVQLKSSVLFPRYQKPFYLIAPLIVALMVAAVWLVFFNPESTGEWVTNLWISVPLFLCIAAVFLFSMNELKSRYWIIEEVDPEKEIPEPERLSITGIFAIGLFGIISVGGFIFINQYYNVGELSPVVYTGGTIIYLIVTFALAAFILNSFSQKNQ